MKLISSKDSIYIIRNTLDHVDHRLLGHGERVAYIASEILEVENKRDSNEKDELFLLALFHDIGAYKTEDINNMVRFESVDSWEHSVYGYLFLKNMSPLYRHSKAILYHHVPYSYYEDLGLDLAEDNPAALLELADRLDVISGSLDEEKCINYILQHSDKSFSPYWVDCFLKAQSSKGILKNLANGDYTNIFEKHIDNIHLTLEERKQFLSMVAYSIDFRSEVTVIHTITTVSVSMAIARLMGMTSHERAHIFYGSLLHDIGKVATPIHILEKKGRLTDDEMEIMKQHVSLTRTLLVGSLEKDIVEIASRHHERMDGSGYPDGIHGESLTLSQCIVAVADVVSALVRRRSYKEALGANETKVILKNMATEKKLNSDIVDLTIMHYDEIMNESAKSEAEILKTYHGIGQEYKDIIHNLTQRAKLQKSKD